MRQLAVSLLLYCKHSSYIVCLPQRDCQVIKEIPKERYFSENEEEIYSHLERENVLTGDLLDLPSVSCTGYRIDDTFYFWFLLSERNKIFVNNKHIFLNKQHLSPSFFSFWAFIQLKRQCSLNVVIYQCAPVMLCECYTHR